MSVLYAILKAQVPSQKSDEMIVRDQEDQKKTIFCTHELSAVMLACTKSMQDEVSQHFSVEGKGVHDPPPKKKFWRNYG